MRAVSPSYNNNEEMRHENKIKIKNHKNDIYIQNGDDDDHTHKQMMMMVMMVNFTM